MEWGWIKSLEFKIGQKKAAVETDGLKEWKVGGQLYYSPSQSIIQSDVDVFAMIRLLWK